MRIISRNEWGAKHGDGVPGAVNPAHELWLHHSVTSAPGPFASLSDDIAAVRSIEAIGVQRFGTAYGVPYTFVVAPSGRVFAGHDVRQMGAHTYGHNDVGRAVCLIGNYEQQKPTSAQLDAVAWLAVEGNRRGWWTVDRLTGGHRDVKATACPGSYAYQAIDEINRRAAAGGVEDDMSAEDVKNIRADIASLRALISAPNLKYTVDGDEKVGSLRTVAAYSRQDIRAVLRAVQGLAEAMNATALAAEVAKQINRLDAEDVVDALAERIGGEAA